MPEGTLATILPGGAKLVKLLFSTLLLKTRTFLPFLTNKSGKSKTRIPPELLCA